MKKLLVASALIAGVASTSAQAASFLNGGFEDGNLGSWTQGGGLWTNSSYVPNAADYQVGGSQYSAGSIVNTVVGAAYVDPVVGALIDPVRYGSYSARINDHVNNASVSTISQSVSNYDGTSINFSWLAVLESSHGATDSDNFTLQVRDNTLNTVLYTAQYNSFNNGGIFTGISSATVGGFWYYTAWQDVSLTVTQGHDFTISLLAADCPYYGHAGYVYLDGFGTVVGGGGDNGTGGGTTTVPEPASLSLLGFGLLGFAFARKRKSS